MNDLPIVSSSGVPPRPDRRPGTDRASSTGLNIGRAIFVLFSLSAFILLGWSVWSMNSVLNARTTELAESSRRIAALEAQLSSSTEVLVESGESMNDEIAEWKSETRKVWANYQRHKAWIEEHEPILAQLRQDLDGLGTSINSLKGSNTDSENTVNQIARQQRDLSDELNTTLQRMNSLLEQLEQRVKRHDEDIEAIDDSRVRTTRDILDIRRRIEKLESN